MDIVLFSDTHNTHQRVWVPDGDLLIFAGDCSKEGKEHEVRRFLDWFGSLPHKHKVFVPGNHDGFFETDPWQALKYVPEGVHVLNDSGVLIEGLHIWGSPVTPTFEEWFFMRKPGEDISRHWRAIPEGTDILVTHGPMFGMLDTEDGQRRLGCEDLTRHVERVHPRLSVFGHIHESYGIRETEHTLFVNASICDGRNRPRNLPIVISTEDLPKRQVP